MEQGSLDERVLGRSVVTHLKKKNDMILSGACIGFDYSEVSVSGTDVVAADGCAHSHSLAWIKAMNNFACSGGTPAFARITAVLPCDAAECYVRSYMQDFLDMSADCGIPVVGGHTEVRSLCKSALFTVTVFGSGGAFKRRLDGIKPDFDIVMAGYTGALGTSLIVRANEKELKGRFSESYLSGICRLDECADITDAACAVFKCIGNEVYYLHDVSCGGVYAALGQLATGMGHGIEIYHDRIPIMQETIEICEFYGINPYMLEGSGALIFVCEDGDNAVELLNEQGVFAAVIGKVTASRDKAVIINDYETRYLSLASGDEIYKVLQEI